MTELLKSFKYTIVGYLGTENVISEIEINNIIEVISQLPNFKNKITKEDKEIVRKQIHAENAITLDSGTALVSPYKYEKWFLNSKR